MLSHDRSDAEDIKFKKGSFITAVNKLNYAFRDIDSFTKIKLFQTYCTAWYGCQSWQLGTKDAHKLEIEWRKSVKRILGLPVRTRSVLLPALAGRTFHQQHCDRVKKFLNDMLQSENAVIKYITTRAQLYTYGPIGKNLVYLRNRRSGDRIPSGDQLRIDAKIEQIRELIRVREGSDHIELLDSDQCNDILIHICTEDI